MAIKATIRRTPGDPVQFTVTITPHTGPHARVLRTDGEGLNLHLREWELGERTIRTILSMPLGMVVTFKLGEDEARGEKWPKAPLVA
jgi:hypothetical protein